MADINDGQKCKRFDTYFRKPLEAMFNVYQSYGDFLPISSVAGVVHLDNLPMRRFHFGEDRKESDMNQ